MGGAAAFALVQEAFAARAADLHAYSSAPARDALMCRRLYLDICGRLPTRAEAEAYIAERGGGKQAKLVDRLLASRGFADYWSMRYCDFLRVKSEFPINLWPNAVYVYHRRIRAAIQNDEPWNDFARALLYGRGSNFRVPESNFLRATARRTPEGLAEVATISFLLEPSFELSDKASEKYASFSTRYARYFSRVDWKSTREWKEELVYLKDGPVDATPEAFMNELEGPLAKKFYATPLHRVHYWLYGTYAPTGTLNDWMSVFRAGGWRLKPLLRHVFASSAYKALPATPGKKNGFPARRLDAEVLDDAICDITGAAGAVLLPAAQAALDSRGGRFDHERVSAALRALAARLRAHERAQQQDYGQAAALPLQFRQALGRAGRNGQGGALRQDGPARTGQGPLLPLPVASAGPGGILPLHQEGKRRAARYRLASHEHP